MNYQQQLDILKAIKYLPETTQKIIKWVVFEGRTQKEVARMLGISPAAVNKRLKTKKVKRVLKWLIFG